MGKQFVLCVSLHRKVFRDLHFIDMLQDLWNQYIGKN